MWVCIIICVISIIICVTILERNKKEKETLKQLRAGELDDELKIKEKEIQIEINDKKFKASKKYEELLQNYSEKIQALNTEIRVSEKSLQGIKKQSQLLEEAYQRNKETFQRSIDTEIQQYANDQQKIIGLKMEAFEKEELQKVTEKINQTYESMRETLNESYQNFKEDLLTEQEVAEAELIFLKSELDDFRRQRAAIDEQRRLAAELENERDFRRIILKDSDKSDIEYLLSIEYKLVNKEVLRKLIWTEFLQKPFNLTLKNILGNRSPKNVIYCIENIQNGKKYIGKTAGEVKKRWTEHIKSSLGIGSISHQEIHEALYGHWDEFIFSILEEVEDGKLGDKEKYYISLFETNKYGYNIKGGG